MNLKFLLLSLVSLLSTGLLYSIPKNGFQKKKLMWPSSQCDQGLQWLTTIFTCPEKKGYCLPNEEEVLSPRFQQFISASNSLYVQAYSQSLQQQKDAKERYRSNWEAIYPLYKEETWPFGRGNGGEKELQNVEIRPLGGQEYLVTIDFAPSYRTVNQVRLQKENKSFFIDYIKTTSIDFQIEGKNDRDLKFTQSWTWEYKDEGVPPGEIGDQGKITAYYNPKTKNWLMNRDSYGFLGEMFIWVIARPDNTYLYSTSSAHPKEGDDIGVIEANWNTSPTLPSYLDKTTELKIFNNISSPIGLFIGQKYRYSGQSVAESNTLYIKQVEAISFSPLFKLGRNFSGEPRLPYNFPEYLPSDFVVLEEKIIYSGNQGEAYIKLQSVKDTLITINIP